MQGDIPTSQDDALGAAHAQPLGAVATLGGLGHNAFERRAGVGVFLEPWIGRRASNVLWSAVPVLGLLQAVGRRQRDEAPMAFGAGVAVAGAVVHFVEWPWTTKLGFVPWLTEAEGLRQQDLAAYNAILWLWFTSGLGSIAFETKPEDLKWAVAGLATAPLLVVSARHHFAWAREQAERGDPHFSMALLGADPGRPAGGVS